MYQVEWLQSVLVEWAAIWVQADAPLRRAITRATHQIDQNLRTDPLGTSESRSPGRRNLLAPPLGLVFRMEPDATSISVPRVRRFRQRAKS